VHAGRLGGGRPPDEPDPFGEREEEVLAIFATAPVVDADELRADLDKAVRQDLRDPYEGTDL
jgi:hypothetical protein